AIDRAPPHGRASKSLARAVTTNPDSAARLNRAITASSTLLIVLPSEESRDTERTAAAVLVLLVVLVGWSRVGARQVGHPLEQSAAAGWRCSGATTLRGRRHASFRFACFVRSAEHAAAAPGRARLDRLVGLGQAAR